jgi:TPR repeat protein
LQSDDPNHTELEKFAQEAIAMRMLRTLLAGLFLAALSSPSVINPLFADDAPATKPATPTADQLDALAAKSPADALRVGLMYRDGSDGVTQDYGKAMTYFTKGAEAGNTKAMIDIGDLYLNGQGVAQDYQQAKAYYQKAITAHDWSAMGKMGVLYDKGLGVTQDYQKALSYYHTASGVGNDAAAAGRVGILYYHGRGVDQDYANALMWYIKCASAGDASAMRDAGVIYDYGLGVPQDQQQAITWYRKAAALGNKDAQYRLTEIDKDPATAPTAQAVQ